MAKYPGALWHPLKQNATQPRIVPTQVVLHSAASSSMPGVWSYEEAGAGGTHTEAHLLVSYDGSAIQAMDTEVRADAEFAGNLHAIAVETASNPKATDAWTPAQLPRLAAILAWAHVVHGIPLEVCTAWDRPGIGWHRLFPEWNRSAHTCPGDVRVGQVPGLIAMAEQIVNPPSTAHTEEPALFCVRVTVPGLVPAVYTTDGVTALRWVQNTIEYTALTADGVPTKSLPNSYASRLPILGDKPPAAP